jgi:hypothetical protein
MLFAAMTILSAEMSQMLGGFILRSTFWPYCKTLQTFFRRRLRAALIVVLMLAEPELGGRRMTSPRYVLPQCVPQ